MKEKAHLLTQKKSIFATLFVAFIIILLALWVSDYNHHRQTNNASKQAIAAYHKLVASNTPLTFKRLFAVLNLVQQAKSNLDDDQWRLIVTSINLDNQQRKQIDNIEIILTQKLFLPLLANRLEQAISTNLKNTQLLYPLLTAYLMLGNPKALQIQTLLTVSKFIIASATNHIFQQTLITATQTSFQGLSLQQGLIDAARSSLNALPIEQQAFLVLENEDLQNKTIISHLQWFKPGSIKIPQIYLRGSLQHAMNNLVPTATNSILFGNLTLGARQNSNLNPSDVSRLLYNIYLQRYSQYWLKILGWLKIKKVKNLDQLQKLLTNFSSNNSELLHVLNVIHNNTDLAAISYVSKPLAAFNNLLTEKTQAILALKLKLAATNKQIQQQNKKQRLNWVKQQIEVGNYNPITLSIDLPTPLQHWLKQISTRYWTLSVQAVSKAINKEWQKSIYQIYQAQFFEHFPFASEEFPDADVARFTSFFKANGTLNQFIKKHLGLFINTKTTTWQWKVFPGFNPINKNVLNNLTILNKLSQRWFTQGKLQINFGLTPTSLAKRIKQSVININGNLLISNQNNLNVTSKMQWNFAPQAKASITFLDNNNQIAAEKQQGPWAWLRILSNSKIMATHNSTVIKFHIGSLQADYEIKNNQFYTEQLAATLRNIALPKNILA